jgi:hypothetical protein
LTFGVLLREFSPHGLRWGVPDAVAFPTVSKECP